MNFLDKKQKILIALIAMILILFIGYYIINKADNSEYISLETEENQNEEENINSEEKNNIDENNEEENNNEYIIVHITGAVNEEGIVEIKEGSRISDVIKLAGGTTEEADLSKINLAYAVKDGQKIYVPNINDSKTVMYVTDEAGENVLEEEKESSEEKININTATQTELETLNGIGPSTALKIINYRTENGKFKKIEDITNVPGIGESKFENIKESICID